MVFKEKVRDFIFRQMMTDDVIEMMRKNSLPFRQMMCFYRCAMMEVETKFKVLNEEFSIQYDRNPIESIKTRIKSFEGIIQKMRRKGLPLTRESIEASLSDIAGIRVICSFPEDIYLLADCLLNQDDITLIERKDYIKEPKPSGYRSLHLIVEVPIFLAEEKKPVRVEVQLRTIAMDFWASLEHKLLYKKSIPRDEAEWLSRELQECARISSALDLRMEKIRDKMAAYKDED